MMPLVIKISSQCENDEYALIELQGDLQSHSNTSLESKFIGDLHYSKKGTPILIIGHHLLHGKEQKLDEPFALLKKTKDQDSNTIYSVECVIKRKIIFKSRPKPILKL